MLSSERYGHLLRLRLGPVLVEAWYELPPEDWTRFHASAEVCVYDE